MSSGAHKPNAPRQPTVTIRVEERVVSRSGSKRLQNNPQSQHRRQRDAQAASDRRAESPAPSQHSQHSPRNPHSPQQQRRPRPAVEEGVAAKRARAGESEEDRPAARKLAKSSAMSARDSGIVNANRERVGSLPGTPRPRKEPAARRRSPPPDEASRRADAAEPRRSVARGAGIERSSSVPAQLGSRGRKTGTAVHESVHESAPVPAPEHENRSESEPEPEPGSADGQPAPVISSVEAVRLSGTRYETYFEWTSHGDAQTEIELRLPGGGFESYSLLMPRAYDREAEAREEYLPLSDLMGTVRMVGTHLAPSADFQQRVVGDRDGGIVRQLERARNRRSGSDYVVAVRAFNALLDGERVRSEADGDGAPVEVAVHVIEQVYSRVVAPTVDLLRQYKAFSNNVYGEILPPLVSEFVARTGIARDSVFVDLGCGIGNVVLQVAAQTGCQASGIEIMEVPARFARRQAREFERRMRLYGLRHGAVRMWRGDFRESSDVQRVLPAADVLLVNNYAFDSALNQDLLQMFLDLKDGARIISLRPFVAPDHKISARNVHAPESILTVRRFPYWAQSVSWTDSGGEYFVQTVDRSRVKAFLARRGLL
ncbi:Nucleosomal histone H3-Lys79 methylase [Coemansia sp. Benny D115]|nr:Nucleosomal histone H3-Lys79 methylase [Coemansia sp. Benny D115]